jgi:hypothetical protein
VSSDFVFLFWREVDLGGRNFVRFMPVHLPLDGSVLILMLIRAPEVTGFGCPVGLFWKQGSVSFMCVGA